MWHTGAALAPRKVTVHWFYHTHTPRDSESQFYSSQSHCILLSRLVGNALCSSVAARTHCYRMWDGMSPGFQLLLSITVRESSSSPETHSDFCVPCAILAASPGVNCRNTLQDATVSAPIHLSCTRSICGSFRVRWPCPLMKRMSQTSVGNVEKRWCGLPRGSRW